MGSRINNETLTDLAGMTLYDSKVLPLYLSKAKVEKVGKEVSNEDIDGITKGACKSNLIDILPLEATKYLIGSHHKGISKIYNPFPLYLHNND